MKKILFMTNHLEYSNGVASALKGIVNELVNYDFNVHIVCLYACEDKWVEKELDKRVRITKVFHRYFRGLDRLVDLLPNAFLYRRIVKEFYDIEVAFQYGMPTKILSASRNPCKIAWIHGYGEEHLKDHQAFHRIVTCAKDAAERYKTVYAYPERVTHLYNPINEAKIREKSKLLCAICKSSEQFVYGTVGRLSPEKGFDGLIRSFGAIADAVPHSELWIIGGGSEEEKLRRITREYELTERVRLLGRQDNPYNFMKQFNVFVCSSLSEGMSTVCTEALMLGVPCISTDVGGSKEQIAEYRCGEVVEGEEGLRDAMMRAYRNPEVFDEYKRNIQNQPELFYAERVKKIVTFFNTVDE